MNEGYDESQHRVKEIKASDITSGDMMIYAAASKKVDVKVDTEEITKAEWVDVDNELPKEEGLYFVLTCDHLVKGFAWFGIQSDEDKEPRFDVWWAASGKVGEEPKVKYWLKDHHWGLVYDFKKKLGELK